MTYACQKLKNAVDALRDAYTCKRQWLSGNEVYHMLQLAPEELPHDACADFEQLRSEARMSGMRENAHSLPQAEVDRLADAIIELYYHVDAAVFRRLPRPRRASLRRNTVDTAG